MLRVGRKPPRQLLCASIDAAAIPLTAIAVSNATGSVGTCECLYCSVGSCGALRGCPSRLWCRYRCRCHVCTSLSCTVATRGDNSEPNRDDDVIVLCRASANRRCGCRRWVCARMKGECWGKAQFRRDILPRDRAYVCPLASAVFVLAGDQDVIVMSSYLVQWFENTGNALLFSSTPYTISGNTCVVCTCRCRVAPQWLQHFCRLHANTRCCKCTCKCK